MQALHRQAQLEKKLRQVRNEAFKDSTLYFLVVLGSLLDDFVRDERITSDVRRDIYMILKEEAIKRGYIP